MNASLPGPECRLRVGVVGLGKVAQLHHLPNLAASPLFEMAALCDLSAELGARLARRYGLPETAVTTDYLDLVARELDAVVVANRDHFPVALAALQAGRHVFVEKPVCWSLRQAEALRRAADAAGVVLAVGYMKRFDPAFGGLAQRLGRSAFRYGRIHNFAGGRHRLERLIPVEKPHDLDPRVASAESVRIDAAVADHLGSDQPRTVAHFRTLCELASHDVNLVRAVLGPARAEWASTFDESGTCGYLALFRHADVPVWMELRPDFATARDWDEEIAFYGSHGGVGLRFGSPFRREAATRLWLDGVEGEDLVQSQTVVSRVSPYLAELEDFHRCVRDGLEPRTGLADAVEDLCLLRDLTLLIGSR